MTVRQQLVIGGLCDLVSATTVEECLEQIEAQAGAFFGALKPTVLLDPEERADTQTSLSLRARGRVVGRLELAHSSVLAGVDRDELAAFAAHAAVALDNARLLEDHNRRARCDPLTGLRNRGEFHEALERMVARTASDPAHSLGLILFDLDRFKTVNDHRGHAAGDRLLRATAAALSAACRSDDAAFRLGGDEFALILPGAERADAVAVAERAARAIGRLAGSAGISWGVASVPTDTSTREGLLAIADANMYEHKGRPRTAASIQSRDAARRLEVASRLAVRLTELRDPTAIATAVVQELHLAFGYYLAVVHRRDDDGILRVVAGAGPLAESDVAFLAWEQAITAGVNGRVARTATPSLVSDTRLDPDYLSRDERIDPGSELSVPILVDGHVWGVLNLEQLATHAFDENDLLLAEAVVAQTGVALHRCALIDEMEKSFSTTLAVLCDALESKDPYTADHAQKVAELAESTAHRLGLADERSRALRYCALLHDIGKLAIRGELLAKPGNLTPAEYEEVKGHSAIGAALLGRIPLLADIAPLVRGVHERWDGDGYPDGLTESEIPIESRIVAVCDAWHAMTSDRPYRKALSARDALTELGRCAGSQFDPRVVDAFITALTSR